MNGDLLGRGVVLVVAGFIHSLNRIAELRSDGSSPGSDE